MAILAEEYDRIALEEEFRDLQQKIDDLKSQMFMIPLANKPLDISVGTIAYSDGSVNWDGTSSAEGLYYYDSTPTWKKVTAPTASATEKGIAELATSAEVIAGTDTSRVITPSTILGTAIINGALVGSATATGGEDNQISIGGVILKWGKRTANQTPAQSYRFNDQDGSALAFTNACEIVLTTTTDVNSSENIPVSAMSTTGFSINKNSADSEEFYFLAIGR